ncbi:MAG TPA: conjugal transfer protein TrbF [Devosia sp.]|nr:conjugal transfer protein TrbF [Devosia sp.]
MFKRSTQRYGRMPEPVTPYQRAEQVWDERLGSARVQAMNWRLATFGMLGVSAALAGGIIWLASQSRITPYVVEVSKLGQAQAVAPALQAYKPSDGAVAWYLAHFISNVRALSSDPVVTRQNWLEAYDYATNHGAAFLNQFAQANDPFKAMGERTVSVQVTSVVRMSDRSFQVKWTEQAYDRNTRVRTERWTGILSIILKPASTADALRKNPLGIYVNAIDWSRELDAQ